MDKRVEISALKPLVSLTSALLSGHKIVITERLICLVLAERRTVREV
jgi:hypothetical protein